MNAERPPRNPRPPKGRDRRSPTESAQPPVQGVLPLEASDPGPRHEHASVAGPPHEALTLEGTSALPAEPSAARPSSPATALPEYALAQGFAEHVARWAHESGAPDAALALARAAAYAVSVATAQGHVCIDVASLDEAAGLADPRAALIASHVAAAPDDNTASPLVVDADGRVYLRRYFEYERRLAQRLVALQRAPSRAVDAATSTLLRAAFPHKDAEGQRLAAALALTRPLALISGGPGTGKTTTIVHVLACLIAQDPDVRIKLAAPTGKAAARMQQAIRERAATLPDGQRTRLPTEAFTVHRLLGARPGEPRFRHDAQHPLAIDVLVVDEASMLDLALAAKLVDAVPPGARIVLCGDKDQLAAVEAGAVFAELTKAQAWSPAGIAALAATTDIASNTIGARVAKPGSALDDSVLWLRENFRFSAVSGIGRAAAAINAGDAEALLATLREGTARWIDDGARTPSETLLQAIDDGFAGYVAAVRAHRAHDDSAAASTEAATVLAAFERFRVLCAEREGPRGVAGINAAVARRLFGQVAAGPAADEGWYAGRPVIVLRNDPTLRLFNGDVGIALARHDDTLAVWFPDPSGGLRAIAPPRLPEHATAFAATVHKSQGSEYTAVLLVLPAGVSRAVTRELLYTAVTRARASAAIAADANALASGVQNPTRRVSGLAARLIEAAASGVGG